MKQLRGRVAIVTGASRGLGVSIAEALAARGVDLSVAARSSEELAVVRDRLERAGVRAIAVECDVANERDRRLLVERTVDELGPVDILINNAGIEETGRFHTSDPSMLERTISVNLLAAMQLTREVLPSMLDRRSGHVVNIASAAGRLGPPFMVPYAASKFGLVGLTQSLACEYRTSGVGFSVVCPAFVTDVGMYARWVDEGVRAPRIVGSCTPEAVVKAVIRAIERNRLETIVNTPPLRPTIVLGTIAPGIVPLVLEKLGYRRMLERAADMHAEAASD